jgi:hypothetical protein
MDVSTIFETVEEIAADAAADSTNPVIATYGVTVEVLASGLQALLGLIGKRNKQTAAPATPVAPAVAPQSAGGQTAK